MNKKTTKYQSLQTVRKIGKLPAVGSIFINGISNRYQQTPPPLLTQILNKKQLLKFNAYMEQLNLKTNRYWPCLTAVCLGYGLCLCTFGLSLLIPRCCVSQSQEVLLMQIKKINNDILGPKKLEMKLQKSYFNSSLTIEEVDFDNFESSPFDL